MANCEVSLYTTISIVAKRRRSLYGVTSSQLSHETNVMNLSCCLRFQFGPKRMVFSHFSSLSRKIEWPATTETRIKLYRLKLTRIDCTMEFQPKYFFKEILPGEEEGAVLDLHPLLAPGISSLLLRHPLRNRAPSRRPKRQEQIIKLGRGQWTPLDIFYEQIIGLGLVSTYCGFCTVRSHKFYLI